MDRPFHFGLMVGVTASIAYIMFGSWSWWSPEPVWARIVFYPGLFAGHFAYPYVSKLCDDFDAAVVICYGIGVVVMACTTGCLCSAFAFLLRFVFPSSEDA